MVLELEDSPSKGIVNPTFLRNDNYPRPEFAFIVKYKIWFSTIYMHYMYENHAIKTIKAFTKGTFSWKHVNSN